MAASGWPIVGDAKHGEPRWERQHDPASRARLAAFHDRRCMPGGCRSNIRSRVMVEVEAPVPVDVRELPTSCGCGSRRAGTVTLTRKASGRPRVPNSTFCPLYPFR
jgi:hypothetical protein